MIPLPVVLLALAFPLFVDPFPPPIPGYQVRLGYDGLTVRAEGVGPFSFPDLATPGLDLGPRSAEVAAGAARQFVFDHKEFYGLDPAADSLVLLIARPAGERAFVQFGQRHLGRPVIAGGYGQVAAADRRVDFFCSEFARLAPDPGPVITPAKAVEIASTRHPRDSAGAPRVGEPFYRRVQDPPRHDEFWRLIYNVICPHRNTMGDTVIVDAFSGEILADYRNFISDPR